LVAVEGDENMTSRTDWTRAAITVGPKRSFIARIAFLLVGLLPGCFSERPPDEIMVNTTPPGASCLISQRGKPLGIVEPTPAIALATLADVEIGVVCRRAGFAEAAVTIPRPSWDSSETRVDITMIPAPPGAVR
jgi:hypothetical protein